MSADDTMGWLPDLDEIGRAEGSSEAWSLLLWEATDLGAQIYDTPDLSIVRGGSVMLDTLGRALPELLSEAGALEVVPLATGASRALVLLRGAAPALAERVVADLRGPPWWLRSGAAACPFDPTRFSESLRGLSAEILRQRLRNLDVAPGVLPGLTPESDPGEQPRSRLDPKDLVRARYAREDARRALGVDPQVLTRTQQDGQGGRRELLLNPVNASRFRVGQRARWDLLYRLREPPLKVEEVREQARAYPASNARAFAGSFVDLAGRSTPPGYLGLIEADGRGFGSFFRGLVEVPDYAVGSALVAEAMRRLLRSALQSELQELDRANEGDPLPAILLVLAGDDLQLVTRSQRALPVAIALVEGWEAAVESAAEAMRGRWRQGSTGPAERAVTITDRVAAALKERTLDVGVVISHADTPVRHLRNAAGELLDHVKQTAAGTPDAPNLAWALLRSHDVLPGGVVSGDAPTTCPRDARDVDLLIRFTRELKAQGCPRSPIKRVWAADGPPSFTGEAASIVKEARSAVREPVGDDRNTWRVIDELWEVVE